jgi:hypothetical protein
MQRTPSQTGLDFVIRQDELQLHGLQWRMVHAETDLSSEYLPDGLPLDVLGGFTEWVSTGTPAISIGWDWLMVSNGSIKLVPDTIRSNLMLVDRHGRDLGIEASAAAVVRLLGCLPWQLRVLSSLSGSC